MRPGAMIVTFALIVALSGCVAASETTPDPDPPQRPHGTPVDIFGGPGGSIPLEDALARVGTPVKLPSADTAGSIDRLLLNETGADVEGRPGLAVLFDSGIKLFIDRTPQDLSYLGEDVVPFTDGRPTSVEARRIDGKRVLVGEPGTQRSRGVDMPVNSRLMWDEDGMGYSLIGPEGVSAEKLIEVFRSMETTGDG